MSTRTSLPRYSVGEEIANSVTHGIGIVLSVAGLALLTAFASVFGSARHIVSCSIYGATQILLYTASTLYHSIPLPRAKAVLRVLDHAAIFLLIAGTYTPFALVNLGGALGWIIFGLVWGLAITGIALQADLDPSKGHSDRHTVCGDGMAGGVRCQADDRVDCAWRSGVAPGGWLCYTLGCAFYIWRRLPYHHAIWHVFVMAGSALHFFAVFFYVIPIQS